MKQIRVEVLVPALSLPLLTGMVSSALTAENMAGYAQMNKPPLSPPGWVFPVAWTLLYLLMGLASYVVWVEAADKNAKRKALNLYVLQLALNFFWPILFFNLGMYLLAFVWLFALWCVVGLCVLHFYGICKAAAYLMIPYVFWLTFAAYLNMGAYILNLINT